MNKFKNENEENLNKWLPELRSGLREIISSKIGKLAVGFIYAID